MPLAGWLSPGRFVFLGRAPIGVHATCCRYESLVRAAQRSSIFSRPPDLSAFRWCLVVAEELPKTQEPLKKQKVLQQVEHLVEQPLRKRLLKQLSQLKTLRNFC